MAPEPQADMMRLLMAVYRFKWVVIGALIVGLGAGIVVSRFIPPKYQASSTLWIESQRQRTGSQGPIRSAELLESSSWLDLLKTFTVLDYVVTDLKLFLSTRSPADRATFDQFKLGDQPRPGSYRFEVAPDRSGFLLSTVDGVPIQRGAIGDSVGGALGFKWLPSSDVWAAGRVIEFTVRQPRDVAVGMRDQIQSGMTPDGAFLRLGLVGTDPELAQRTVNVLMHRFVAVAANLKRAKLDELTELLNQQREVAETNLKAADAALETFKIQTITMPTAEGTPLAAGVRETRDPVISNFFQMKMNLEDLRRDRIALDNVMKEVAAGTLSLDALTSVPAAAKNGVIANLLSDLTTQRANLRARQRRYTDEHDDVKPVLAAVANLERVLIPAAVVDLKSQLQATERDLEGRIGAASDELKSIPPRLIEEARLTRRVQTADALHSNLRHRYEEARLAALSSVPDIGIIDEAVISFSAFENHRPRVIAIFGIGAVGLALILILLLDRSDRRVRYPDQVTAGLGLPILGAVPRVKGGLAVQDSEASSHLEEAFRELRLAIGYAHGAAGPLMLSVSSPESGDGKSTVAGALAGVFASQGHKVVLIDGDIRRGDLHRSIGLRRVPGLTDFLAQRVQLDDVLQPAESHGFMLIGSGTRMHTGPELLGSPAMGQLIRTLRSQFGVIIVDTPPLGAGVDAYVLGAATGNMILVVRTGRTNGQLAEAKLSLLDRLPVRMLGAVLNDVPASRLYSQYSYLSGYEAEDEMHPPLQPASVTNGGHRDSED